MAAKTRKLTLEARVGVPDGAGGISEGWTPLGVHWAALRPVSVRERFAGGRQVSAVTHVATLRAAPEGDPARPVADQRFREGARVFSIRGVAEADDQRRELTCWLEEGALS